MARKTDEERLLEIQQKQNRLKEEEKKIKANILKKERNARTRRLIEVGAIMESVIADTLINDDKKKILLEILYQKRRNANGEEWTLAQLIQRFYHQSK